MEREGANGLQKSLDAWAQNAPRTVEASALLREAADVLKSAQVDQLIVVEGGAAVGMLDIQHVLG
jgi:signal-transduction protein with cAMP-binding, CBS, and nucleotidyltransferase domain